MGEFLKITLSEYLADRGRFNGSTLGLVESEPELVGRWMAGEDIDRPTPAKGRGSVVHAKLLEPDADFSSSFARYPNRNEAPDKDGVPQDPSPAGARKSMLRRSKKAQEYLSEWQQAHKGLTWFYPEDETVIGAMVRAVRAHPEAAALLHPTGFAGEVTAHWDCTVTGAPLRARYDGLRIAERRWVELKTMDPKQGRLDTTDPQSVIRWVRGQGFARKSAMCHDAFVEATGEKGEGYWVIVEATEKDPRVSVVRDVFDSPLAELGRDGCADWGIKGYYELIRMAQEMRSTGDYSHGCVREVVPGFELPAALITSMSFEDNVQLQGARKAPHYGEAKG